MSTFYVYGPLADIGSAKLSNQGGAALTSECGAAMINVPSSGFTQVAGCSTGAWSPVEPIGCEGTASRTICKACSEVF